MSNCVELFRHTLLRITENRSNIMNHDIDVYLSQLSRKERDEITLVCNRIANTCNRINNENRDSTEINVGI